MPHNPESFAEKIIYLLENEEKRKEISNNAYKFSQTQTWDKIIAKLLENYNEVISSYRKALKYKERKAA
jgi:glycosyltransferase involved in cell wall biosynthesis